MILVNTAVALLILWGGYFFVCAERIKEDLAMKNQDEVLVEYFKAVFNQIATLENGGRIDK